MRSASVVREVSAGAIVGLSAIIYSLSYGALLFSGGLAPFVGYGITIALVTAALGAALAWWFDERSFIVGPDSNTTSVMASILAASPVAVVGGAASPSLAVTMVIVTALVCAGAFQVAARTNVAALVRYIPFPVMAGFLASTGWLMSSGAMNIIGGTPLTIEGGRRFMADPVRPELAAGLLVTIALLALARRVSTAILIPAVMVVATVAVNVLLGGGWCGDDGCNRNDWMFSATQEFRWLAPWELRPTLDDLRVVAANLPGMLIVAFVGLLTILLSVASLELSYDREFELDRVLRVHAAGALGTALVGGFVGIVSIGRTTLNRQVGGTAIAASVAALICIATLVGGGGVIAYVPKAALGGLVLFLGVGMLRQWIWDQRRKASPLELAQILLIVGLVAKFGFLAGFGAGIVIACVIFVVTYSRIPIADLRTNLGFFPSTVVRPDAEAAALRVDGTRVLLYRLSGYMFFGSASAVDNAFRELDERITGVLIDFSNVSGIDSSAVGVFQRILRRFKARGIRFYLVHSRTNVTAVRSIVAGDPSAAEIFAETDHAIEAAEEALLRRASPRAAGDTLFSFLESESDRREFTAHCDRRVLGPGDLLCREGDHSNEVFFVESGSLEVIKTAGEGGTVRLAKLRTGAMVGELAFYTGEARTAAIAAAEPSTVLVLDREALDRLRAARPGLAREFDRMVITALSHALARTNQLVSALR